MALLGISDFLRTRAATAVVIAVLLLFLPSVASAQESSVEGSVRLVDQSSWVSGGQPFSMQLAITTQNDPNATDLVVTVFGPLPNRTAFQQSLNDRISGTPVLVERRSLAEVLGPNGEASVVLPVGDPNQRRFYLRNSGVYPVRVELKESGSGGVIDQFTTHLVNVAGTSTITKLSVSTVLPIGSPINEDKGVLAVTDSGQSVADVATALAQHPDVPTAVLPQPESIERLEKSNQQQPQAALSALRDASQTQTKLASSWTAIAPALYQDSYGDEATRQLDRGSSVVSKEVGTTDTSTWVGIDPLDTNALTKLRDRGFKRFVIPETSFTAITRSTTLARPFALSLGRNKGTMPVAQADVGLSAHFEKNDEPVLRAHQLLADLAVIWNDLPAQTRSVVVMPPRYWVPNVDFLNTYLAGLANSPLATPVTLDQLFAQPTEGSGRNVLVRQLASVSKDSPTGISANQLKQDRQRMRGFASMVGDDSPALDELERRLLWAESIYPQTRSRDGWIKQFDDAFKRQLSAIRMPAERSVRLTARQGEIPVSIQNDTGYPVDVVVKVSSNKVIFPEGASRTIRVERAQVTERIAVDARTSGAFPVQVRLESPDGSLLLVESKVTIRSTAASGIGVGLTVGAGLFLLLWWLRSIVRNHRSKATRLPNGAQP